MTFKAGSHKVHPNKPDGLPGTPRFSVAFREALHNCKYLAIAAAAAAIMVQGFVFNERKDWLFYPGAPFARRFLLAGIELYPYVQALFALAVALFVFGFLFSKRHAHNKFALPLTRQTIFSARFLAGALCSLVPSVSVALTSLTFSAFLPNSAEAVHMSFFWRMFANFAMQALMCYAIAVFACLKAGNWVKALVNGVALLAAPGLVLYGIFQMMQVYLPGYGYMINHVRGIDLDSFFPLQNPVSFLTSKLDQFNTYAGPRDWFMGRDYSIDFITPVVALALTALLVFLCYKTFIRYPAENAGQPEIGKRFTRWLAAPLSLGVTAICLTAATSNHYVFVSWRVPGLLALSTIISVALYILLSIAFRLWETAIGRKKFTRMLPSFLCVALLPLAVAVMCKYGFPGYAGRAPEPAQVRSVVVSYRGLHSLRELDMGNGWYGGHEYENSGELLLVTREDIALAMELQQTLAARQRQMGKTVLANSRVDFIYTLQDGKRIFRRFWKMDAACYEALLQLDQTSEFDEVLRYMLSLPASIASADENADFSTAANPPLKVEVDTPIYLRLPDGKCVWPELNGSQRQVLLQTLYEELSAQTLRQRYFPDMQEAMTLYIPLGAEEPVSSEDGNPYHYVYFFRQMALALYPEQFSKTLAILQEAGGDFSQNTEFARAVAIPAQGYLEKNTNFDSGPPPAVFYAFGGIIENQPLDFIPKITKLQSEITGSRVIESLYRNSTTQTSYARDGYLVWFIRADKSSICRFVEKAEFEKPVK